MYHSGLFIALFRLSCVCVRVVLPYRKCSKSKKKWCLNKTCTIFWIQCWNWSFYSLFSRHVNVNNYIRCRPINTSFAPSFWIYLLILFGVQRIVHRNLLLMLLLFKIFRISDFLHEHTSITWFRWCRTDSQKSTYESSLQVTPVRKKMYCFFFTCSSRSTISKSCLDLVWKKKLVSL